MIPQEREVHFIIHFNRLFSWQNILALNSHKIIDSKKGNVVFLNGSKTELWSLVATVPDNKKECKIMIWKFTLLHFNTYT